MYKDTHAYTNKYIKDAPNKIVNIYEAIKV